MTMTRICKHAITAMALIGTALPCGYVPTASAATYVTSTTPAGVQCQTTWINDNAQAVGNCTTANVSAYSNAWYSATLVGAQQILPRLVSGQPCTANAISNNGWILGHCANAANLGFAVFWSAASPGNAPIATIPLPGTLLFPPLRPADVQTVPSALNQQGTVLAQSISAELDETVVLYLAGNPTPRRVSNHGDNCKGVDVNNTPINGSPSVIMNCPDNNPALRPTIATWTGSSYTRTHLPSPPGASYCWATGMNDQLQAVGTCVFNNGTAGNEPKTAFWATPTSAPLLLTMPLNAQNQGIAINNLGHILAYGHAPTGFMQALFWIDPTNSFSVQSIQPLAGSNQAVPVGISDNDTVGLNCLNSSQLLTGCYWTPSTGTVAMSPLPTGLESSLNGISRAGGIISGYSTDGGNNLSAVGATLP